ncbi:site-specific DNA-methyltransferase [Paracidovorax avenae]|uniref:site-specific DNA-methyltransferase n=1 Tax=Paracidovorax avenae TaxID=80867 RepID=UPI000D15567B|nr:site-specific DNA-methyltransferase [Paracidovorax avenae]AVS79055.1 site-specific DNA-methyltransferase [Paracidovorax avenae]AVS93464.1 site-specific DNA-methyltransferase [Paracidovorax avenae]AVT00327.1 site-specific DNA-methyltransferase [Paracidovorax avenae]AVT21726.1 site-specific DNA-methyltransferase [Paracidovorax avenae]
MSKHIELVTKLREIFQIDRPDLDFGIYRILNTRAAEINVYLEQRLPEKVKAALSQGNAAQQEHIARELQEKEAQYQADGIDPGTVPKVRELREKLAQYQAGASEHENAVFSHLLAFFSRYYKDGDFISQRRYKGDTYAIPYAGEEVMLHWANKDQYYTKSGENFANYSFKLDDGRIVHFRLTAADTAKDNRKDNDKERRFALIARQTVTRVDDQGDQVEEELIPVEEVDGINGKELVVRFEYAPQPNGTKQDVLVQKAVAAVLAEEAVKARWLALGNRAPTEKNPQRTLLEKQLSDYTTKNTADYFIHKDLGGFLRRELDFYIKNEVMNLDDVQNASAFGDIEKSLRIIQCLRTIALELIAFLSQVEDFQKKLWLKKKFVVSCHYCVTLDRVPEALWPEILANDQQWTRWKDLGVWSGDAPGTAEDLKAAPYRMVDTALFDSNFKRKLVQGIDNLDAQLDGLLVHGDNFQGLNLLSCGLGENIKAIYIDPPYNTDAGPICYKNGYRSSSWASLMDGRIKAGKRLLRPDGVLVATIDDYQYRELNFILEENFGKSNIAGTVVIRMNPSGRPLPQGFAQSHEYAIFAKSTSQAAIESLPRSDKQNARYKHRDDDGNIYMWELFRKRGSNSERKDRPSLYYPIYVSGDALRPPRMEYDDQQKIWHIHEAPKEGEIVVYPIDDAGIHRTWRGQPDALRAKPSDYKCKIEDGVVTIYYKFRPDSEGVLPLTNWIDAKYSATEHGTGYLKKYFSEYNVFSYPKSIYAVEDCLRVAGANNGSVVLDYFAGSGTTAHAIINMNRADRGNRKYVLIEQGEYFDSVIKSRLQKAVFSGDWDDGKPTIENSGLSHCMKIIKLESYEDTLNNLHLRKSADQEDLFAKLPQQATVDYLLNYMLDVESRDALLSLRDFKNPFKYTLNIAIDSAGAFEPCKVDLVETFNYLIGLRVKQLDAQPERGFVTVTGTLPSGETCLVLWRDCEKLDYEGITKLCDRLAINPADNEYDVVYINGDHNIPTVLTQTAEEGGATRVLKLRQIEPEFLERMFSTEDF